MPYGGVTVSRIISVADGDCFVCDVDTWPPVIGRHIPIRIAHMDAPELDASQPAVRALAYRAKHFLARTLNRAKLVELSNVQRGKYFRLIAAVSVDGHDLAQLLITRGLALPYEGGKKPPWAKYS